MAGIIEILPKIANDSAITGFHGSLIIFFRTYNALQQRRFAGSIGPYKAYSLSAPHIT